MVTAFYSWVAVPVAVLVAVTRELLDCSTNSAASSTSRAQLAPPRARGMSDLRILEAWQKDPVTLQPYATFRATTPSGLEVTATREGLICYPSARLSPTQALELAGALRVVAEWVSSRNAPGCIGTVPPPGNTGQ